MCRPQHTTDSHSVFHCIVEVVFVISLLSVPPVIFVVIGLTTVLDEYVVYARNETGGILTDSAGNDIISL